MYADDLVLLARNERDLQLMLVVVHPWCSVWNITVNSDKSQIVHFTPRAVNCSRYRFKVGSLELDIVDRYKYNGLYLYEFLDFKITADYVAKAASRALGILIAKSKALGGMPFKCFKKL